MPWEEEEQEEQEKEETVAMYVKITKKNYASKHTKVGVLGGQILGRYSCMVDPTVVLQPYCTLYSRKMLASSF